jgi:hypothetical protein
LNQDRKQEKEIERDALKAHIKETGGPSLKDVELDAFKRILEPENLEVRYGFLAMQ